MDPLKLLSRSSGLRLNNTQRTQSRQLPSAGDNDTTTSPPQGHSKKRKRDGTAITGSPSTLTEPEIRQIHKQHRIKITDLKALHSGSSSETRKVQKESARLFPQPLQSFNELRYLDLDQSLSSNISSQAYKEPTEVQLATIPLLLKNGAEEPNLLTVAPTGSGKTLAFLIPLIDKIAKVHRAAPKDQRHFSALLLAPTRELVSQIVNEGRKLTVNTGVRIAELRKGMKLHETVEVAESQDSDRDSDSDDDSENEPTETGTVVKADILVSAPLSLLNIIQPISSSAPLPLPNITSLVLDEADVLLDPLFRDQTLTVWSSCTSTQLRVSLWSATIGSSIEELALSTINTHPSTTSASTPPPLLRTVIGLKDTSLPSIDHKLIYASTEQGKLMGLRQLIHPSSSSTKSDCSPTLRPPFIIFTQTIPRAQALFTELQYDIPALTTPSSSTSTSRIAVLHSSLTHTQRSRTMTHFRTGKIWILITTDLLSRGIDFRGVNGIVNYDIPTTPASYVHRAGRTGRAGRQGGIAVTLYTKEDIKYLKPIANIIAASQRTSSAPSAPSPTQQPKESGGSGLPQWLLPSLPSLPTHTKHDLRTRGVPARRGAKESDSPAEKRAKKVNRIGTASGVDRRAEDRLRGMKEGSRRRVKRARGGNGEEDEWGGIE